jgi:hypothetical protein
MTPRATRSRMSLGRRTAYALAAAVFAAGATLLALLAVDVYLHGKFEQSAGFNVWGYRGPAAGRKQADEYRVAVLGGSAAYGYGTTWDQAIPALLERQLSGRSALPVRRFTVVNLGYNNEGAYSFKPTLDDYSSLHYDLACLYEGYNDLMGDSRAPNVAVFRHDSPVFRLTGYMPIFPIVFKEKAAALAHGDAGALYRDADKTVFHAGVAARAAAGVLDTTAAIGQSLERQLGKISVEPLHVVNVDQSTGCKTPWQQYCRSVLQAVDFALGRGAQVVVVTQPYAVLSPSIRQRHVEQQAEMAAMLARRFGGDPRVAYVNLGPLVDLSNPRLSFDQMHLTPAGNARVAEALVAPVLQLAANRRSGSAP